MIKKIYILPVFLVLLVSACSNPSTSTGNFTYPSTMTIGYLPVTGIRTLFVANTFTGTVSEINTSNNSVIPVTTHSGVYNAIPLNMYPAAVEFNNGYLYVAGFTQSTGLLEAINLSTNSVITTTTLKGYPVMSTIITGKSKLFVIDSYKNSFYLEAFTVGNFITPSAGSPATLTFTPSSMTLSSDNSKLFISYMLRPVIGIFDPDSLNQISNVTVDNPVTSMEAMNNGNTILYATVLSGTSYYFEAINTSNWTTAYEFSVTGIPANFGISSQRFLLDDNHFSYIGVVPNEDGYITFLNIDDGCNISNTASSYNGLQLTSSVPASNAPSLQSITTNDCTTQTETWSIVYSSNENNYFVTGTASGLQPYPARQSLFFDSLDDSVSFYISPGKTLLNNGDEFVLNTIAATGIKALIGLGLPSNVLVDPLTNQAYVTDILSDSVYVISIQTQAITATIK